MRVTLNLDALDGRILPGGGWGSVGGGTDFTLLGSKVSGAVGSNSLVGDATGGHGGDITVSGSQGVARPGSGVELFGTGYKPGTTGGQGATDTGIELFGSNPVPNGGQGLTDIRTGIEL